MATLEVSTVERIVDNIIDVERRLTARLDKIDGRLDIVDSRLESIENKLDRVIGIMQRWGAIES